MRSLSLTIRRKQLLFILLILCIIFILLPSPGHNEDYERISYLTTGQSDIVLSNNQYKSPHFDEKGSSEKLNDLVNEEGYTQEGGKISQPSPDFSQSANLPQTGPTSKPTIHHQIQDRILSLIKSWKPTSEAHDAHHWPPYDDYLDKDYDPNTWESFEWTNDFYLRNGIKKIREDIPGVAAIPYSPYPVYNSDEWKAEWRGAFVACEGPRGKLLNESEEDIVKAYRTLPSGFPDVSIGDANATGIDLSICFDRFNRYGPYGFGQTKRGQIDDWKRPIVNPIWAKVDWGRLQARCLMANHQRYDLVAQQSSAQKPSTTLPSNAAEAPLGHPESSPSYHHRTAILVRTWEGYEYTENDMHAIRALITECSLLSGGEYQVFLFVNLKGNSADIFRNPDVYESFLDQHVPEEFREISILWNEDILKEWYPLVGDWQVYWHQFMPVQWFSKTHPEFDFVWNWETDTRYTGNHYNFLEMVSLFARKYPRKYMWERNQRFFFPSIHGSYAQWLNDTDNTIERGMQEGTVNPVWGPRPYNASEQNPIGPIPPTTMESDNFTWGVGEEADLITLLPIWDPTHTEWDFRDKIWNFVPGVRPHFTPQDGVDKNFKHPEFASIPRRTYINTVSRFSKRVLHAMHMENRAGRTMQAEMWPATVALHHGLKAVYVPHPIWTDRKWPGWYADAIFNADGGNFAQWSQGSDSVYAHDREHNFGGWSWYYNGAFAKNIYRRWLGWTGWDGSVLRGVEGQQFEEIGVTIDMRTYPSLPSQWSQNLPNHVGGQGRMCLPAMLLHPIKNAFEGAEISIKE